MKIFIIMLICIMSGLFADYRITASSLFNCMKWETRRYTFYHGSLNIRFIDNETGKEIILSAPFLIEEI